MSSRALPVFYDARQNASNPGSASPSAHKPAEVMTSWRELGDPHVDDPPLRKVLELHDATLLACARAQGLVG